LTYHYVSRTLSTSLRQAFVPPVIAGLASLALYWGMNQIIDLNALPLLARVVLKGGVVAGLYFAAILLLEQRLLVQRIGYLWGLLWSRPA
jgi:hypothetical protein